MSWFGAGQRDEISEVSVYPVDSLLTVGLERKREIPQSLWSSYVMVNLDCQLDGIGNHPEDNLWGCLPGITWIRLGSGQTCGGLSWLGSLKWETQPL